MIGLFIFWAIFHQIEKKFFKNSKSRAVQSVYDRPVLVATVAIPVNEENTLLGWVQKFIHYYHPHIDSKTFPEASRFPQERFKSIMRYLGVSTLNEGFPNYSNEIETEQKITCEEFIKRVDQCSRLHDGFTAVHGKSMPALPDSNEKHITVYFDPISYYITLYRFLYFI